MSLPPSQSQAVRQRSRSLSSLPVLSTYDPTIPECTSSSSSQGAREEPEVLRITETPDTLQPGAEDLTEPVGAQQTHCLTAAKGCGQSFSPFQEAPRCAIMNAQLSEGAPVLSEYADRMDPAAGEYTGRGEESEEDSEQESSQDERPILDRLGLSSVEMTEDEVERAFSQLALAFRCDQYTLRKRLQAEEHTRNLAEENIHLELQRGGEILQSLKGLCLDSTRSKILQRLELCLSIVSGTVERIANAAEVLGAVHQEARVSRAVDLMVAHVENLKRRHARDRAELEEARRQAQKGSRNRQLSDPRDEGEMRQKRVKPSQQGTRRRISVSVISRQPKPQGLSESRSWDSSRASVPSPAPQAPESGRSSEPETRPKVSTKQDLSGSDSLQTCTDPCPNPQMEHSTQSPEESDGTIHHHSPPDPLHQRRGRNREVKEPIAEEKKDERPESDHVPRDCDECASDTCTPMSQQHPLAPWMSHCRFILFWLYVLTISFVILLGIVLWKIRGPLFWI